MEGVKITIKSKIKNGGFARFDYSHSMVAGGLELMS